MGKALIIGCGGVASVAIAKCCQNSDVFTEIMIASRTKSKCDAMKENADGGEVRAIVPDELISYVRQYDPSIHLIYGRDAGKDSRTDTMEAAIVYDVINNEEQDKETFREVLALSGCNYLVLSEEHTMDWYVEEEYEKIAKIDEYCIYRIDK